MKKIELLSPAGNMEKLRTAFEYGADAVYMGLKDFSLRTKSDNFDFSQFNRLKQYSEGKKVYLAVNIYFHEDDIKKLKEQINSIKNYSFDGFIISDIGIFDIIKDSFPEAEIHLSTQANCINSLSAKAYSKMGFNRIILGRETPLSDIKKIRDENPDLGIEVFCHGAMCMAYSGRCLLSSHLTGRSANMGDCSHTCRWNYRLALEEESRPGVYYPIAEGNSFTTILSSKDLCMIDHLSDLRDAGVDSVKIEGRMKSTYYVATVTRAYRKALDYLYDGKTDFKPYRDELFNVSHRPYSTGFFYSSSQTEDNDDGKLNNFNANTTDESYIRNYIYLGTVGKRIRANIYEVDIKNQISSKEQIEFTGPDILKIEPTDLKIYDSEFNETDTINHCQTGYIGTTAKIREGYIIRKKIIQ